MTAPVKCPRCERALRIPPEMQGRVVKCRFCGGKFAAVVPTLGAVAYGHNEPDNNLEPSALVAQQAIAPASADTIFPTGIPSQQQQLPRKVQALAALGQRGMPGSVIAILVLLILGILGSFFDLTISFLVVHWLNLVRSSITLILSALLLTGVLLRSRITWQACRVLGLLGGLLLLALCVLVLLEGVQNHPGRAVLAALFAVGLAACPIGIFVLSGRLSVRAYFDLVCPQCGSIRVRSLDFLFRRASCPRCKYQWSERSEVAEIEDLSVPHSRLKAVRVAVLALVGVVVLAGLGVGGWFYWRQQSSEAVWREFRTPDGKCIVMMPGEPVHKKSEEVIPRGKLPRDDYTVRLNGGTEYSLAIFEYPDHLAPRSGSPERGLDGARDGVLRGNPGVQLRREQRLTVDGSPGRDLEYELPGNGKLRVRLIVVGKRFIELLVIARGPRVSQAEADKFFNSFQLVGEPPRIAAESAKTEAETLPQPIPDQGKSPAGTMPAARLSFGKIPLSVPAATELQGLLAYWKFDEGKGSEARESGDAGLAGKLHGAGWTQGVRDHAVRFTSAQHSFDLGDSSKLNFEARQSFTLGGWFASEQPSGIIVCFQNSRSTGPIISVSVEYDQLAATVREDGPEGGFARVRGGSVGRAAWHHFALTRTDDGTIELYLDGISLGRKNEKSGGAITTNLRTLGRKTHWNPYDRTADPWYFLGAIDEFCVFNRALPSDEIRRLAGRSP